MDKSFPDKPVPPSLVQKPTRSPQDILLSRLQKYFAGSLKDYDAALLKECIADLSPEQAKQLDGDFRFLVADYTIAPNQTEGNFPQGLQGSVDSLLAAIPNLKKNETVPLTRGSAVRRLRSLKKEDEERLSLDLAKEGESIDTLCNWISKKNLLEDDKATSFISQLHEDLLALKFASSDQERDVCAKKITNLFLASFNA